MNVNARKTLLASGISILAAIFFPHFFPFAISLPSMLIATAIGILILVFLVDFFFVFTERRVPEIWRSGMGLAIPLMLGGIVGCTALGLTSPQSFDEQLAEAYGVHTAAVEATADAFKSGAITMAEAQAAQTQLTGARAMLDAAHTAESTNATGAAHDLTLASAALSAVQAYLNSAQAPAASPPAPSPQ